MFRDLTRKEVLTLLRNRRILISVVIMPIVMFTALGFVYSASFSGLSKQVTHTLKSLSVLVCNLDRGALSRELLKALRARAAYLTVLNRCSVSDVVKEVSSGRYSVAMIIPKGASANFTRGVPARVEVFTRVSGASLASSISLTVANSVIDWLNSYLRLTILSKYGVNPKFVLSPVVPVTHVIFRGRVTSPRVVTELATAMSFFIMAPMVIMMSALNFAATSMATENEEKTLEILLSLPIPRTKLVASKLAGTLIVVLISTASFSAGLMIYAHLLVSGISSATGSTSAFGATLLAQIGPYALGAAVLSIFTSLVALTSLGILVGSFAPSVRTSASIVGQFSMLIVIPNILMIFLPLNSIGTAGLAALVALSPFVGPVLAIKAVLSGMEWLVPASIGWSLCFSALMIYVTAKLLNSERLLSIQHTLLTKRTRLGRRGRRFRLFKK